ncbi:MAG: DNA polymerase III subunit beta [Mycoplasma sp.]|nr:DNA polymerase III subunit beta [Candidatus Hennigella equi]
MKFTVKKNEIVSCLKNINSLIDSNNLNPTLSAVHIKALEGKLIFIATNGAAAYQQTITNVEISKTGDILVKAKLLYSYLSKIDQDTITINQIDDRILQINTPKSSSEIILIDDSSFPILDFNYDGWKKTTITYDTLVNISQRVKPFTSSPFSNSNLATTGILFNPIDEKQMECVASDSFRMAYYKFDYLGDGARFIIEPKAIDMAVEILSSSENKTIDLYLNDKECILNLNSTLIKFSLFKDTYPNIIKAILSEQKYSFTVKLSELIHAINRGSVFVSNEQRPITNLKIEDGKLIIKSISNETGNSFEQVDISKSNVENFEIKLNQRLLITLLNIIKSDNISFNFNNTNAPIVLSSNNPYFLNLIVPLRS